MSTLYIIFAIIVASVIATTAFVVVGAIEHHKRINLNWVVMMTAIVLACSLVMVLIYHHQNDITEEGVGIAINEAYQKGLEDGVASEHHTYPSNEEVEEWMASTQEVIISTHKDGSDPTVHIIDGNGEEWILIADTIESNG